MSDSTSKVKVARAGYFFKKGFLRVLDGSIDIQVEIWNKAAFLTEINFLFREVRLKKFFSAFFGQKKVTKVRRGREVTRKSAIIAKKASDWLCCTISLLLFVLLEIFVDAKPGIAKRQKSWFRVILSNVNSSKDSSLIIVSSAINLSFASRTVLVNDRNGQLAVVKMTIVEFSVDKLTLALLTLLQSWLLVFLSSWIQQ